MEKRLALASLLLILAFSPLQLTAAVTDSTSRQLYPLDDIDIWIDALSYYTYYWTGCKSGGLIYGSFEVTYGTDVTFFICDRATYNAWVIGNTVSVYELHESVGSLSYSFSIPSDGIWHVVFYNDDLFYSRHIEGTVSYISPSAGSALLLLLALGGVVLLAIAVVACSRHAKPKAQPVTVSGQGYVPQQYPLSSQPVTQMHYCPSCGAARRSPHDKFCPNCGRSLEPGPELR